MTEYQDVVAIVEDTSYESLCLWKKWHKEVGYEWIESNRGPLITVGMIDGRPVCIAPLVHVVNGRKLMFVEATSQLVDWKLIDDWLYTNVPNARRNGLYINKVSANNFHNVVH